MELLETIQETWAIRAFLASSMVGIMCGVLGCFVVLRNMSLIGDALSHAVLPGVVFAFMIFGLSDTGFFVGSVIAGLIAAVGMTWIQQNVATKNDAAIGIVFTVMFSIGVIGISWISKGQGVHLDLKDFLFGNILGVSDENIYLTGGTMVYVIVSVIVFYRYLFATTFQPVIAGTMGISVQTIHYFLMLLLSFAVVASIQTVGVILVVAMLITPAATALLLSNRLKHVVWIAGLIGFLSAVLGMLLAIIFDTTPGPAMTVTATLIYLLAVFFAPNEGLLFKYLHKKKLQEKIYWEDTLKQIFRQEQKGTVNLQSLNDRLHFNKNVMLRQLAILKNKGFLTYDANSTKLTTEGIEKANRLVRAHRLWETYLVDKIGLTGDQIHEEAEKYEHLLTDELLDEVDASLGFPKIDPHGSPIPNKKGMPILALSSLHLHQTGQIAAKQISKNITSKLWELGLLPKMEFSIQHIDEGFIEIKTATENIKLDKKLAQKIEITI